MLLWVLNALLLWGSVCLAAGQSCSPPEDAVTEAWALRVAPGTSNTTRTGYVLEAGQAALIEGAARFEGGLLIRGRLFLSSRHATTLEADWISIEAGGALIAGSEACPLGSLPGAAATIRLFYGASPHPDFGFKALALRSGGSLELHGTKGLAAPWARLAATADAGATVLTLDADVGAAGWAAGDAVALASTDFDPYQVGSRLRPLHPRQHNVTPL